MVFEALDANLTSAEFDYVVSDGSDAGADLKKLTRAPQVEESAQLETESAERSD